MDAVRLLAMVEDLAELPYGLEPVDQRMHAYQTAGLALGDHADPELVSSALFHDIGRHSLVEAMYPGMPHEESARRWCDQHFSPRVGWLVWAHVPAKRYLVATDPGYQATLSRGSVASFPSQGGAMTAQEVVVFEAEPWFEDAVRLRRWDDLAKDPEAELPDRGLLVRAVEGALGWG